MSLFSRNRVFLCLALVLISAVNLRAQNYENTESLWRQQRAERLSAQDGWLSLIGLHWLTLGQNTIGAASDNSIQLSAGPAHFGIITWEKNQVLTFLPAASATVSLSGKIITGSVALRLKEEKPEIIQCGTVSFFVIVRGDKIGLRVKDTKSIRRRDFAGLDYFPVDPKWKIEAKWVTYTPTRTLNITNVLGQTSPEPVPGKAVFDYAGKTYELTPIDEGKDEPLFFIIRDKTSGTETYGASRFLYSEWPKNGIVVLDFNRAENPPCAFSPYATCPLPPKENRLPFAVTAGEKSYKGEAH